MQDEGSEYDRFFYPFLFEGGQVSADEVLAQVRHSIIAKCEELIALRQATLTQNREQIITAGLAMAQAFATGATLFAFGNGGSATDVQDLVADLLNPPCADWRPLPAIALTNDIAVITAVGNDVGFDNVFTRQIIAFGKAGDMALGISTSGTSKNVLAALGQARLQGMMTIGLAGYDGGKMAHTAVVDYCLIAPSDHVPRIQEAHATLYHTLLDVVQTCLAAEFPT